MAMHAGYSESRISANLKGSTKQFGWLQASATNPPLSQSDPQTLQPSDFVILAVNAGFGAAAEACGELDCWMLVFRRKFLL